MKVNKILSLLFFLTVVFSVQAQTKLINHKSHSGTNKTFNPKLVEGNFGAFVKNGEINENQNSNYKLAYNQFNSRYTYYLFYTKRKNLETNMCLKDDRIIEKIIIDERDKEYSSIVKRLKKRLEKLRKKEKKEQL